MEAYRPDLLLMDINMPTFDGFDLARRLKGMYPDCPVLMVSAVGDDSQFVQSIATACLCVAREAKPVLIVDYSAELPILSHPGFMRNPRSLWILVVRDKHSLQGR